jgi:hypothetical protein
MRALARNMGRPTREGKICSGKLLPANPHFTNLSLFIFKQNIKIKSSKSQAIKTLTPVPLSQTTIFLP